jgi:hypothetical protein
VVDGQAQRTVIAVVAIGNQIKFAPSVTQKKSGNEFRAWLPVGMIVVDVSIIPTAAGVTH